jgi:phosphate/sulfate permease
LLDDANNGDSKNKKYSEGIINETSSDADEEKSPSQPKQHEVLTDEPKTARLLAFVQILTASFASFAHGSNDVRLVQIPFSGSSDTNHDRSTACCRILPALDHHI